MVIEAFSQALQNFGSPVMWVFLLGGVIVGLFFGLVPGINTILSMALFLPYVIRLTAENALVFMQAMNAVGFTSGAICAILINIPGQEPNAATLIDGYPMTQKGQGGRALGAALVSSGLGGATTVLFALVTVPLILPIVMAITSADMVFITLLGICFLGVLSTGSMIKGLVSGGLGLLISFIGFNSITGVPRFAFGSLYLYDGIRLLPLLLGLFAVPEVARLAVAGGTIAKVDVKIKGMQDIWEGAKDVYRYWGVWLRGTIIGYIIGIIPGLGASIATFLAYAQTKQTSKHPEKFGTGCVEGVIAPESADNAKEAGAVLTTLALGIPGSPAMAILISAFLMLGLVPGPKMMSERLDLALTLFLVIIIANILAVLICLFSTQYMIRIALVPSRLLSPLVLVIAMVGIYAYQEVIIDLVIALIFALLGLAMWKFGFSRPALILGFILGRMFERYVFIALLSGGPLFFVRPISLALILIIVALFAFGPAKRAFQRRVGVKKA